MRSLLSGLVVLFLSAGASLAEEGNDCATLAWDVEPLTPQVSDVTSPTIAVAITPSE